VFPLEIPALRDREDDIVLLAHHFAAQIGQEIRGREAVLSPEAVTEIRKHKWPGNVRELENAIERACILSDDLILQPRDLGFIANQNSNNETVQDLDLSGTLSDVAHRALALVERKKIIEALENNSGNKSRTAEDLGISYKTLLNKLKDYGL
jgi:DNA-binding NtrC family response regulator